MATFVQLSTDECTYLLETIEDMDSSTAYTKRQREYTVPKLEAIRQNPQNGRLHERDITYLLELIEDDDAPQFEQIRLMTQNTLESIKALKDQRAAELEDVDKQRQMRRTRRQPAESLQEHFQQTTASV